MCQLTLTIPVDGPLTAQPDDCREQVCNAELDNFIRSFGDIESDMPIMDVDGVTLLSHVASIDCQITDLDALDDACKRIGGLELVRGVRQYKWYGESVGDTPLPRGFKEEDLGKCEHVVRVKDNEGAYEVGVVRRRDGKPGYVLMLDSWNGGYGLVAKVGKDCQKLVQNYTVCKAIREARKLGHRVTERTLPNGTVRLELAK